ncbi:hypothetical protein Hanom_Chr04g00365691 [Helianthus anomalus]
MWCAFHLFACYIIKFEIFVFCPNKLQLTKHLRKIHTNGFFEEISNQATFQVCGRYEGWCCKRLLVS